MSNIILDTVERSKNTLLSETIRLFERLNVNRQELRTLKTLNSDRSKRDDDAIDNFEFEIPEHTLDEFLELLYTDGIEPKEFVHFRELRSGAFKNVARNSYTVAPDSEGQKVRYNEAAANPNATEENLADAYKRGVTAANLHNTRAREVRPQWVLLKRTEGNDSRAEDQLLRFLDSDHSIPDWYHIILNIKRLGESLGYAEHHYRCVLDRYISYYEPNMAKLTSSLSVTEIARFMMRLTAPESVYETLNEQLSRLVRRPNDNLKLVINKLYMIATGLSNDIRDPREKADNITRLIVHGLTAFTQGKTQQDLLNTLKILKKKSSTVDWVALLDGIVESESIHGTPTVTLTYNSPIQPNITLYNTKTPLAVKQKQKQTPHPSPLVLPGPRVKPNVVSIWDSSFEFEEDYSEYKKLPKKQHNLKVKSEIAQEPSISVKSPHSSLSSISESEGNVGAVSEESASEPELPPEPIPVPRPESSKSGKTTASGRQIKPPSRYTVNQTSINLKTNDKNSKSDDKNVKGHRSRKDHFDKNRHSSRSRSYSSSRDRKSKKFSYNNNKKRYSSGDRSRSHSREKSHHQRRSSTSSGSSGRYTSRKEKHGKRNRSDSSERSKKLAYKPGENCSSDYKFSDTYCFKCISKNHCEFLCPIYYRYSIYKCKLCLGGYHWATECQAGRPNSRTRESPSPNKGNFFQKKN